MSPASPEVISEDAPKASPKSFLARVGASFAGFALVLGSISLREHLNVGGGGLYSDPGRFELYFWFIHVFFLLPGFLLLGWGLAPTRLVSNLSSAGLRSAAMRWILAGLLVAGWTLAALLLRWYWLDGRPITAGEETLRFGARLWAAGEASVPAFDPAFGFSEAGLNRHERNLWPAETPGALLFSAMGEATGLGQLPAFLLAALAGLALVGSAGPLAGPGGRGMAALLWTFSPMVLLLGISATGELWARSFLAFVWASWLALPGKQGRVRLVLLGVLGFAAAAAITIRPGEAACLLLPVGGHLAWTARQHAGDRASWLLPWSLAASGLLLLVFLEPAGSLNAGLPNAGSFPPSLAEAGEALASGSAILALLLVLFFAGPLLLPLLGLAFHRGGEVVSVAAAALLLTLLHPLTGAESQHAFGPAVGSAAAIPLLVLALVGIAELRSLARPARLAPRTLPALGLGALLALSTFSVQHAASLTQRATLMAAFEPPGPEPAIVLVEPVQVYYSQRPELALWRGWRGELPLPDPFLRDRVLFARASQADPQQLAKAFPRRQIYRVRATDSPELFSLERLR